MKAMDEMNDQMLADAALFRRIRYWKEFREGVTHLFPTDGALRWFIRQNEETLVASGVLLKLPRGNYIDPEPFRAAAMRLMQHGGPMGGHHGR
jgi:hypothetical protein